MFYLHTERKGHHCANVYQSDYNVFMRNARFPAGTRIVDCVIFKASGRTYAERKESARQIAQDFQRAEVGYQCLSWSELAAISDYFQRIGKRYGLLEEFRENGIC